MSALEYARHLIEKAKRDEVVVAKFAHDFEVPDEVIGFHAQQAIEKLLEAVPASAGVSFRRTHDLTELIDLVRDSGIDFPARLDEVRTLSPFAVEFRYDDLPVGEKEFFDRKSVCEQVREVRRWAEMRLSDIHG